MRLLFLATAATVGLLAGAFSAATAAATAPSTATITAQVKIDNYAFKPASITLPAGATVVWKNLDDEPHTATANNKEFDSKGLAQGDTFSYKFTKPGTYTYYCKLHPFMKGTVIIKEGN